MQFYPRLLGMKSRGCVSSSLSNSQEETLRGPCAFNRHTSSHQSLAILPKGSSRPSYIHHTVCTGVRRSAPPQSCARTTAFSLLSLQRCLHKALVCALFWMRPGLSLTAPQQVHTLPPCAALCSPALCEAPNLELKIQVNTAFLGPLYFPRSSYCIPPFHFGTKAEVLSQVVILKP